MMKSSENTMFVNAFTCDFAPVAGNKWRVMIVDQLSQNEWELELRLNDKALLFRDYPDAPALAIDLLEIALMVHTVDRTIVSSPSSYCVVEVTFPVRTLDIFNWRPVQDQLSEILYWYTGYEWRFKFTQRGSNTRLSEYPQLFQWSADSREVDVALWSGGLDCFAGLFNRAYENEDRHFVLCGTGSNPVVHKLQKRIYQGLPQDIGSRTKLCQVNYRVTAIKGILIDSPRLRSRGFVFMLIGAVCALLEGRHELQVYENGIGAINLRFRDSEIGLNHAHSVHPLSLKMLSNWLTDLLGEPFTLHNPFLFSTKAQMCEILVEKNALELAFQTETCDRKHRKSGAKQCGRCSSCILRRQAFAALGITDKTPYVYEETNWLHRDTDYREVANGNHIPAALWQVEMLEGLLRSNEPWNSLVRHYETLSAEVVDRTAGYENMDTSEMQDRLLNLFEQYVREWN